MGSAAAAMFGNPGADWNAVSFDEMLSDNEEPKPLVSSQYSMIAGLKWFQP